jgi:hypothetical protein
MHMHAELRRQLALGQAGPTAQLKDEAAKALASTVVGEWHRDTPLHSHDPGDSSGADNRPPDPDVGGRRITETRCPQTTRPDAVIAIPGNDVRTMSPVAGRMSDLGMTSIDTS